MFGMVCCQYKPPLYLAPFGRNLQCKFLTGDCKPPVWEKEMVVEGLEISPPSTIRYDTIEEINVDSKAEYKA